MDHVWTNGIERERHTQRLRQSGQWPYCTIASDEEKIRKNIIQKTLQKTCDERILSSLKNGFLVGPKSSTQNAIPARYKVLRRRELDRREIFSSFFSSCFFACCFIFGMMACFLAWWFVFFRHDGFWFWAFLDFYVMLDSPISRRLGFLVVLRDYPACSRL